MASGYHIGQRRHRTFSLSKKILLDSTIILTSEWSSHCICIGWPSILFILLVSGTQDWCYHIPQFNSNSSKSPFLPLFTYSHLFLHSFIHNYSNVVNVYLFCMYSFKRCMVLCVYFKNLCKWYHATDLSLLIFTINRVFKDPFIRLCTYLICCFYLVHNSLWHAQTTFYLFVFIIIDTQDACISTL